MCHLVLLVLSGGDGPSVAQQYQIGKFNGSQKGKLTSGNVFVSYLMD